MKKDFHNFIEAVRRVYKKWNCELKYIYRIEIGKRGAIHIHVLINQIVCDEPKVRTDKIIKDKWKHGRSQYSLTYEEGGFQKLAEYICKLPNDDEDEDEKKVSAYGCSRNLIEPEPEVKDYVKRYVPAEPKPSKGYYIVPESIVRGMNPFNGLSYLKYVELRL